MDGLPKYSRELSTDFLKLLASKGYTSWHVFSLRDSQAAFWKAVGLGILLHSYRSYCKNMNYFRMNWNEKVRDFLAVDAKHFRTQPANQSQQRFTHIAFWNDIGIECVRMAIDFYTHAGKMEPASLIRSGRLMEYSNAAAFSNFAGHFDLFICLYERCSDSHVITHNYVSPSPSTPTLCINLAQEGDRLYYLYHESVKNPETEDFPFMIQPGKRHPIAIDTVLGDTVPQPSVDIQDRITKSLFDIVETQANLILTLTPALPSNCAELQSALGAQVSALRLLLSTARSSVSLETSSLQHVLRLPVTQERREPHTITTCELYSDEDADIVQYHSHKFHRTCLKTYIERLQLVPPELPMCPMQNCGQQFADSVLDLSPTVAHKYQAYRDHFTLQTETKAAGLPSSMTLPVVTTDCWVCLICSRRLERAWFLVHGCRLCYFCAAERAQDWRCPLCRVQLREDEINGVNYTQTQLYQSS